MTIKGILFDFDGTIVDSEVTRFKSTKNVLEENEIKFTKEMWDEKFKSLGSLPIFDILKKENNKEWNSQELYGRAHKIRYEIEENEGVPLIKGFKEFYEQLKKRRIKTIVCSGGTTEHFEFIKKIVGIEIDGFGRDEYENRKPEPDAYLQGLKRIGLDRDKVIVIEDARTGIQAANKLGIKTIAINYIEEEVKDLNLFLKVKDYTEIDLDELLK